MGLCPGFPGKVVFGQRTASAVGASEVNRANGWCRENTAVIQRRKTPANPAREQRGKSRSFGQTRQREFQSRAQSLGIPRTITAPHMPMPSGPVGVIGSIESLGCAASLTSLRDTTQSNPLVLLSSMDRMESQVRVSQRKENKAMAEVAVVKHPKKEAQELTRAFGFETPLFRGNLFTVNPFALLRQFTEEMDRVFGATPQAAGNGAAWLPAIEVKEKEGKLLLTAELPGVKKEDVKVHIDGDTLIVEGERKQEKEEKREGYYHSERSYGVFYREIPLPEGAKADQTAAQFNNGVLEVSVPIPEVKTKRQDVPIQEASKAKAA